VIETALSFLGVGLAAGWVAGYLAGTLHANERALKEHDTLRRLCEERIDREAGRLAKDRDALFDRWQARSLAELEQVRMLRETGPQKTEPLQVDPDWADPSFARPAQPVYEEV
jgi:hypothetical protein